MGQKRKHGKRKGNRELTVGTRSSRSQSARQRALHVLAAMRRNPKLSLSRAAREQGTKPSTVVQKFPKDLVKSKGMFRATKGDRHSETLYIPNAQGIEVPVQTRSFKTRKEAGRFYRDFNRYLRGNPHALEEWRGKKIAGVEVLTDPNTIKAIDPALPDFSLYRTFTGGAA
ncbi:MAG TPA: hypothetical protein VFA90_04310 [Terriglobales bacterium]|nr:hypothetical protein [Terriglobales bacterium]